MSTRTSSIRSSASSRLHAFHQALTNAFDDAHPQHVDARAPVAHVDAVDRDEMREPARVHLGELQ